MSNAVAPNEQRGAGFLQPHPLTSVMQLTITAAAVCVAAAACTFAIRSMSEERNAKLFFESTQKRKRKLVPPANGPLI
jgi:hypothetical protein